MPRPRRQDRETVADRTVGVRLSPPLFAALERLVEARNSFLVEQGIGTRETPASFLRSLLEREIKAKTMLAADRVEATLPRETEPAGAGRPQKRYERTGDRILKLTGGRKKTRR